MSSLGEWLEETVRRGGQTIRDGIGGIGGPVQPVDNPPDQQFGSDVAGRLRRLASVADPLIRFVRNPLAILRTFIFGLGLGLVANVAGIIGSAFDALSASIVVAGESLFGPVGSVGGDIGGVFGGLLSTAVEATTVLGPLRPVGVVVLFAALVALVLRALGALGPAAIEALGAVPVVGPLLAAVLEAAVGFVGGGRGG
jgi:hypothetical protein